MAENNFWNPDQRNIWEFIGESLAVLWKDWPKEMEATCLSTQNQFSLTGLCPYGKCGNSVFMLVTSVHQEPGSEPTPNFPILCAVLQCQGCRRFILGIVQANPDKKYYKYLIHFPLGKPDDSISSDVPPAIASDFSEAIRCRSVNAYNATVEMCRRAIQSSCEQLGADKELKLESQIDWVQSEGKITAFLKDMAHKIRLGGNRGAHPSNRVITPEDADAVIEFTREYLDHIYIMPAKMAKFDFSKSGKKS